jgi:hypothetical protein
MEWKRTGWELAFTFLVMSPLTIFAMVGGVAAVDQGRAVWTARDRTFASGIATRAKPLTTPAGAKNVAAWVGRVGRKEGKARAFRAYCTIGEVDGVLVGGRALHGWDAPGTFELRDMPDGTETAALDFAPARGEISLPEAAKRACLGKSYPAESTYEETTVPIGTRVEVSGCFWKDALTPCRDRADLVTVRSARERFAAARTSALLIENLWMFITALAGSYLAWAIAGHRILLDRRLEKKKKKEVKGA